MRLNKFLSQTGIASRRKADKLISERRVEVNGVVAEIGTTVNPDTDTVRVDGKIVRRQDYVYIAFYKPRGCTTTLSDPHAEITLKNFLPKELNVFPVGRLDKDAEGLLLLTNDGDFAFNITHPKFGVEKEYEVALTRSLKREEAKKIIKGIESDGDILRVVSVSINDRMAKVVMAEAFQSTWN
jgi:16S rRNA U516 pseudouridylate synthase RsuA-like enzyme